MGRGTEGQTGIKRITSKDVARKAGVSQSAVSRTFTPGASVASETREKVIAAANVLGYRPNVIARSLSLNRTRMIGLIMVRVRDPFYACLLDLFTRGFQERQYWTLLLNTSDGGNLERVLSLAMQYQVDGLITTSAVLSSELAEYCASCGVPLLVFNRFGKKVATQVNNVRCDHYRGTRFLGAELVRAGHKRIAFIAGEEESSTSVERENGFLDGLAEQKARLWARESAMSYEYEAGYSAAHRLLTRRHRPDAIFAANDMIGMAVIDCAVDMGISVPGELSVAGFDGLDLASHSPYRLTTIRQPVEDMVQQSVDILLKTIDDPLSEYMSRVLPGKFIPGASARLSPDCSPPEDMR